MTLKTSNDYDDLWLICCIRQAEALHSVVPEPSAVIFGQANAPFRKALWLQREAKAERVPAGRQLARQLPGNSLSSWIMSLRSG